MGIVLLKRESIEPFLSVAVQFSTLALSFGVMVREKLARYQGLVLSMAALSLIYSRTLRRQKISQLEHSFSLEAKLLISVIYNAYQDMCDGVKEENMCKGYF